MPRLKHFCKISKEPAFKGFQPFGGNIPSQNPIVIGLEEVEAIRRCDYELLTQEQASVHMGVSRPTLTRIYESARRKVATAFSEGRPIIIEGGRVFTDTGWANCTRCGCRFSISGSGQNNCSLCGSTEISITETPKL